MKTTRIQNLVTVPLACMVVFMTTAAQAADPLPSWNEGKAKQAIVEFVAKVTKEGSPDFVPVAERIATFDNDGTLWCEQPMYFQLLFALDRVKALAPQHPCLWTADPDDPDAAMACWRRDRDDGVVGREHRSLHPRC